jgi:DinB superfamily
MNPVRALVALPLFLIGSTPARAQSLVPPDDARQWAERPVAPIHTVSQALDFWITATEHAVVTAAAAMPAEKYAFTPTGGEFTGVRTFGQQVKHLAANNYRMAAYILGRTPTADQKAEAGPDSVQSKTQTMDYVTGSFVALHEAVAAVTDGNMLTSMAASPSARQTTRLQLAVDAVAHSYDHYGQMVEYLRMNGIVPPGSR